MSIDNKMREQIWQQIDCIWNELQKKAPEGVSASLAAGLQDLQGITQDIKAKQETLDGTLQGLVTSISRMDAKLADAALDNAKLKRLKDKVDAAVKRYTPIFSPNPILPPFPQHLVMPIKVPPEYQLTTGSGKAKQRWIDEGYYIEAIALLRKIYEA